MTALSIDALSQLAVHCQMEHVNEEDQQCESDRNARLETCVAQFNDKCNALIVKYFDETSSNGIHAAAQRACSRIKRGKHVEFFVNFDKTDFIGWNAFVPYRSDFRGHNANTQPTSCLRLFLHRAKLLGYLPNTSFHVWTNAKLTVHFIITLKEVADVAEDDEWEITLEDNYETVTRDHSPLPCRQRCH